MQKLKNKNGTLTSYALSCGYVESHEWNGHGVKLWREHTVYHVRHTYPNGKRTWESTRLLKLARKWYRAEVRTARLPQPEQMELPI